MNRRTALKAILGSGLSLGCRRGSTPHHTKSINTKDKLDLSMAIRAVEMEGVPEEDWGHTVGIDGELGPMQITEIYVRDVNIIAHTSYCYADRTHMGYCRGMMMIYWEHYATIKRLGHEPTLEDLARIHNGGPNGWRKDCTKKYWVKVRAEYERLVR